MRRDALTNRQASAVERIKRRFTGCLVSCMGDGRLMCVSVSRVLPDGSTRVIAKLDRPYTAEDDDDSRSIFENRERELQALALRIHSRRRQHRELKIAALRSPRAVSLPRARARSRRVQRAKPPSSSSGDGDPEPPSPQHGSCEAAS